MAIEQNPNLLKTLSAIPGIEVVSTAVGASIGDAMLNIYSVNGVEDTPLSSLAHSDTFADIHNLIPTR